MAFQLHSIKPKKGARKNRMRVGRGLSKKGTYSGRGAKGQRARSGGRSGLKLKGMRKLMLSIPKLRGFRSPHTPPAVVNVGDLARMFSGGATVTPKTLLAKGLIDDVSAGVKILGNGEIAMKLTIEGCKCSASAKEKITAAGGKIVE